MGLSQTMGQQSKLQVSGLQVQMPLLGRKLTHRRTRLKEGTLAIRAHPQPWYSCILPFMFWKVL